MTFILYMLLVLSFSLGVLTRFSLFPGVNIYMQDIFIFLIILLNTKKITKYIFSKKNSGLIAFLCLFTISLVGIITHVSSVSEFFNSFLYLLRLYGYLLLLIPLVSMSIKRLNQLKVAMIISGFIFISFGYVQYLYYPNLRNLYYLGWDEHLSRLFSTLLDPNFAGTYILLILILFLSVVFEKFKSSKFKSKAFFCVGLFFVLASLLLTYSRSAYLVSVFSLSLFLYLLGYKKLIAILFVVLILGIYILPQGLGGEGVNLLRSASIFARFDANMQGLYIFIQNPLIGVGYNTLRYVQVDYGYISMKDMFSSHAASGFPNSFVVLLATTGLLGMGFVLFILGKTMRAVYKIKKQSNHSVYPTAVFVSLVAVLINSLFENSLLYGPIVMWVVLLMGILIGYSNTKKI